jgi:hypothetical protein
LTRKKNAKFYKVNTQIENTNMNLLPLIYYDDQFEIIAPEATRNGAELLLSAGK